MVKILVNMPDDMYKKVQDGYVPLGISKYLKNSKVLPDNARFINADEILDHAFVDEEDDGTLMGKKWYCIDKDVFDKALVVFDTMQENYGND